MQARREAMAMGLLGVVACARVPLPSPANDAHSATMQPSTGERTASEAPASPIRFRSPDELWPRTPAESLERVISAQLGRQATMPCTELDMPDFAQIKRPPAGDELGIDNLGRGIAFGVPRGTVTAGRADGQEVAVYLSYALDPSSEVGDGGYRVVLRDLKTGAKKDFALPFAMMRPYVVFHDPKLPLLFAGDLQLAADVRQVDDDSISFPPVAMRAKQERKNRFLRCPLTELERDTDGDGLTDIEETKLLTDPSWADTDNDGLLDAVDPAPLGADPPSTVEDEVWIAAMKQIVAPQVKDELVLVETGGPRRARLALTDVHLRVLELTRVELAEYQRRFGSRTVADVEVDTSARGIVKVYVSLGWKGGSYSARKDDKGQWTFIITGWWVT